MALERNVHEASMIDPVVEQIKKFQIRAKLV